MHNVVLLTDFSDPVSLTRIFGPYKLANELRKQGLQVTVINYLHMFTLEEILGLLDQLVNSNTLFVGVNNVFYQNIEGVNVYSDTESVRFKPAEPNLLVPHGLAASQQVFEWLKRRSVPVVLGGPLAYDIADNSHFDYIIRGFAETSIVNFVNHLTTGDKLTKSYRSCYGPIVIDDSNTACNFDFAHNTFSWHDDDCVLDQEVLNIELARGCIFKCNFCSFPLIGKKKRDYLKDPDLLEREFVENYQRFGTTRYYFSDETFNDSPDKVDMIWEISRRLPFQLEYFAYMRLDLAERRPDTIPRLFESGLRYVHFGIETLNERAGDSIAKPFSFERAQRTLAEFKRVGQQDINLHATFMTGLPYEDEASARRTHELIKSGELGIDSYFYFPTIINRHPFPQSYFSQHYEDFGYTIVDDTDPELGAKIQAMPNSLTRFPGTGLVWRNSTNGMNYFSAFDLAMEFNQYGHQHNRLGSVAAYGIAGLGLPDASWQYHTYSTVNWYAVTQAKRARFQEYRQRLLQVAKRNQQ